MRRPLLPCAAAALIACLGASSDAAAAEGPAAELAGLDESAIQALDAGRVVLLETTADEKVLTTRCVAVVDSGAEGVLDAIRDYSALPAIFPEVQDLDYDKGPERDTFRLTVKPHPMLPRMDFTKAVEWSLDGEGGATVGISLLETTSKYVESQRADYRIVPLEGERSLVFYETRNSYHRLSFRQKVLRRMAESSERLLADVRSRCAPRAEAGTDGAAPALALLSSGGVASPLR